MKRFITAALFFLAMSVHAQTTPPLTPTPVAVPSCFPAVNGIHAGVPRHVSGEVGQHVYWFCVRNDVIEPAGFSCIHGSCLASTLNAAQQAIITSTAKVRTAREQYLANVTFQCGAFERAETTPRGALCRERQRIFNAMAHSWVGLAN